ncbi:hypothetical protein D3C74_392430 [compost metagenome]
MLKYVLTIARTEFQTAQDFNQVRMQSVNAYLEGSLFTVFTYPFIYFLTGLLYHFLDSSRMDTSIRYQLLKCRTGHFASNRVKA